MNGVISVSDLTPDQRQAALQRLASRIHGWRIGGVAQLLLSVGQATSVVSSHLLLLLEPFAFNASQRNSLHIYAAALEDDASWQELIGYLKALQS